MEDIRTSPERYDRIKGKVKTKNPFAANLSSVAGSKRTMMTAAGAGINHRHVDSPIKEETMMSTSARPISPRRGGNAAGGDGDQSNDWYKPELGEIPYAPLTKANRAKIDARDREIAAKEAELDEIMKSINIRK